MTSFVSIACAVLFALFLIGLLVVGVCSMFWLYFLLGNRIIDSHKDKVRTQGRIKQQPKEPARQERRKVEIVPEELYAVSQEEYEADMMAEAPQSPLEGCDDEILKKQIAANPTSFFRPSQN